MRAGSFKWFVTLTVMLSALSLGGCLQKEGTDSLPDGSASPNPGAGNSPPSISGSPSLSVIVGQTYSFVPGASDADGDALSFSVANLPSWATFDSNTGEISGLPTIGDIGTYSAIVVTVSDGITTASLPAYSITVSQTGSGSMTLYWTAPSQNTDGSALVDLAGYRIYYGRTEGDYPNVVDVATAGTTTIVVDNLTPDTYYVVATAVNSSGTESGYSNVVVKVVSGS